MTESNARVEYQLTDGQARLVARHGRALLRLAHELTRRGDFDASAIMFIVADIRGRVGCALRAAVTLPTIGPVVLPGRAGQLSTWLEQLGSYAPVWDFQGTTAGLPIIVIDEFDVMAVTRLEILPKSG